MPDVKRIDTINTNIGKSCTACSTWLDGTKFEDSVNHYLQTHGWVLLHVGEQTEPGDRGQSHHMTVAVLGEPKT